MVSKPQKIDKNIDLESISKTGKARQPSPIFIKSPQSMNTLPATTRYIMDELRERHKKVDAQKSGKNFHPGGLLTIDKIAESLQKFNNLGTQAKSVDAINHSIKQMLDVDLKGSNRMVYLYPYLIKGNNKVIAKLALISPQSSIEVDVRPYREACFEYSKPMMDVILSNRSRKVREVNEDNPGNGLLRKNKNGDIWLYPTLFSLEEEINHLVKKAFEPYTYYPIKDFTEDFIYYGNEKGMIEQILPTYHIIIDELEIGSDGTYVKQPELVKHYRAQADALERFALKNIRILSETAGLSNWKKKLADYKINYIDTAPPGRKQNREKVKALIELIREFPFDKMKGELSKNIADTCFLSIRILDRLLEKMNKLIERKNETITNKLKKNLHSMVTDHTKRELTLLELNLKKEIERGGIKDSKDIEKLYKELLDELKSEYGLYIDKEKNEDVMYIVDQSYMASVLHKITSLAILDQNYKKQLEYAKIINQEMIKTQNHKLNSKVNSEHIDKLHADVSRMETLDREKRKREELRNKYNFVAAILGGVISQLIFTVASVANSDVFLFFVGVPISLAVAYIAATFFSQGKSKLRKSKKVKKVKEPKGTQSMNQEEDFSSDDNTSSKQSLDSSPDSIKNNPENMNMIAKAAERFIFPANYNKIEDKVFDNEKLKEKIKYHLDDIKRNVTMLSKLEDDDKVFSAIQHSLMNHSTVINVPPDLTVRNQPNSIIISKNDFKAPLMRNQIAEYFRKEADKNKVDEKLVKYYRFLINTLEVEYYKYLPRKKL